MNGYSLSLRDADIAISHYELLPKVVHMAMDNVITSLSFACRLAKQPDWIPSWDILMILFVLNRQCTPPRTYKRQGDMTTTSDCKTNPTELITDPITAIGDPVAFLNQSPLKMAIEHNLVKINMYRFNDLLRQYKFNQQSVKWTFSPWICSKTKTYWRAATINLRGTLRQLRNRKYELCFFLYMFIFYLMYAYKSYNNNSLNSSLDI